MTLNIERNKNLKEYNTFGIEAVAPYFCQIQSTEELQALFRNEQFKNMPLLVLGGGSNILFTRNPEGLVLLNKIGGISMVEEGEENVLVKVGGGVVWHEFVLNTIAQGLGGLENLSLIPGTVGAAPMQNIGAYGVEIKDTFHSLEAVNRTDGSLRTFRHADCQFGYRSSVFKTSERDKWVISHVTFSLHKKPQFNTTYGAIQQTLEERGISSLSLKAISDAVVHIRQSKLPDPKKIGNAGSFFKNPVIDAAHFTNLQQQYASIPSYPQENGIKVPAGWLIEQCGWKGYRRGNVGVNDKQALVLVNHGGAIGEEIRQLSEDIQASVKEKFGIELEAEVNFI
ncbi:UDP-N-acetylmuramate dehydrogenase [Nafulsella turpanensis]|uniref:UDP-N-acetylmuramate dehydrogenase n=1 Tax=Nafulsella turpanensis TaxID=1265690 RepID=UPI00034788B5|nr:UDP-N-acetylmuramate dehydrogenase [Nafulsella turpanensis]